MKLAFVNFGSDRCGGNRVLFEVVNGLVAKGHDVSYLAMASQNWYPLKVPIMVKQPQELAAAIPESDVVVATWCATAPIVDEVKGAKGVPAYYCQHHEPIFFFTPQEQQFVEATYRLKLNLVANSPWLAGILKDKYGRESSLIVPGVDQKVFHQDYALAKTKRDFDDDREKALAEYQVTKAEWDKVPTEQFPQMRRCEPFKVLAFSSQTPFKGLYDTVLPAFHYVHRLLGSAVEFHLYGAPLQMPLPFPVIQHSQLSDEELAGLYNSSDLFVSGSWAESSPLPHLEAMACGVPVVCTAPGTEHYGEALFRVPPRAPRHLGETIFTVLQTRALRDKMSALGLISVKEFTWQNTVDRAELFFKGLVGEA